MQNYTIIDSQNRVTIQSTLNKKKRVLKGITKWKVLYRHVQNAKLLSNQSKPKIINFKYNYLSSDRNLNRRMSMRKKWIRCHSGLCLALESGDIVHPATFGTDIDCFIKYGNTDMPHLVSYTRMGIIDKLTLSWIRYVLTRVIFVQHRLKFNIACINNNLSPSIGSFMDAIAIEIENDSKRTHIIEIKTFLSESSNIIENLLVNVFKNTNELSLVALLESLVKSKYKRNTILRGLLQTICYRCMAPNTIENVHPTCHLILLYPLEERVINIEFDVSQEVCDAMYRIFPLLSGTAFERSEDITKRQRRNKTDNKIKIKRLKTEKTEVNESIGFHLKHEFHLSKINAPFCLPNIPIINKRGLSTYLDNYVENILRNTKTKHKVPSIINHEKYNKTLEWIKKVVLQFYQPNVHVHYKTIILKNNKSVDKIIQQACKYIQNPHIKYDSKTKNILLQTVLKTHTSALPSSFYVYIFFHPYRDCFSIVRLRPKI